MKTTAKGQLAVIERGLYKYAICEGCGSYFVSSRLKSEEAHEEIHEKSAFHNCQPDESA